MTKRALQLIWVAVVCGFGIAVYFWLVQAQEKARLLSMSNGARQLTITVIWAAQEKEQGNAASPGWPAESGCRTMTEYFAQCAKAGLMKDGEFESIRDHHGLQNLVLGNVAGSDPANMVIFATRNIFDAFAQHRPLPKGGPYVLFHKGGDGVADSPELPFSPDPSQLPPRTPAFLAP